MNITKMTMADVREANQRAGQFFFARDTMRFFRSKVESTLYKNATFVTSEQAGRCPKRYAIRRFIPETGEVKTLATNIRDKTTARVAAQTWDKGE